ncbi:MAG TPA: alpha-2-macroglobulin family protein [Spirochaetota bacterium]|nr:alpha-2-macroglobulin family protein [Spirochaetota bacterium]HOL57183.1 alpha-2-macroglobulin family protein [Spirochaetota bacterium]HPP04821.1 alpha-2-macroglobulin family protein [Spirochaetota bacterium]
MKYRIFYAIFLIFAVSCCKSSIDNNLDNSTGGNNMLDKYAKLWEEVYSFENKGLPKSAKEKVDKIYELARKEENSSQIIKSIIHIMKYRTEYEEEALIKIIKELEESADKYSSPSRDILYSIMAELYWNYYENNRYKFLNRTETENFEQNDIRYWDLRKLISRISELYYKSLENRELLKSKKIEEYKDILVEYTYTRNRRPTLYDFLIWRAISFFANTETGLTEASYKFELMDDSFFDEPQKFINLKIETEDKDSFKYKTLLLYQDFLKFHINDKEKDALFDADLNRIIFVKNNFVKPNKDQLYFNALIKMKDQYKNTPFYTEIAYLIGEYYFNLGSKYIPEIAEDYKWYNKKAVEIIEEALKKYPESIGSHNCEWLLSVINTKELSFENEKVYVPEKPFLYLLNYKNVNKVYIKIVKVDNYLEKEISDANKFIREYSSKKGIFNDEINLIDDRDYNKHSVELKLPSLKSGYYYIFAGTDKEFKLEENAVCYSSFWISNISFIENRKKDSSIELYVIHRENGEPLPEVKVNIYESKYNDMLRKYEMIKTESYITDKNGYIEIPNKDNKYRYIYYEFIYKDDKFFNDKYVYQNSYYGEQKGKVTKTFFFTDRSIYRPGQTIYFKGLVLTSYGKENEIVPNKNVTIQFYDVNWQLITSMDLKTNEFGTFNGKFIAPTDRLNGIMTIYNSDGSGQIGVSVEEYKRPKFEVSFEPVKESFKVGEKVKITGIAKAYAGFSIDNASVKYRVVRKASFPYWWWWWNPPVSDMEIVNGTVKSDENGKFIIEFDSIPDYSISPDKMPVFNYYVYADITDINGETHSAIGVVRVGYVALQVNTDIPDTILKKEMLKVKISTLNLNGEFEPANGTITVSKLKNPEKYYRERMWNKPDKFILKKEEFEKDFPYDQYNDEANFYKWDKEKIVLNTNFNTNNSDTIVLNDIQNWDSGKYIFELKTKDKYGKEIIYKKYFTLYSTEDKRLPFKNLFFISAIKSEGEPNESAKFEIGTSAENMNLYYFIESNGKIIKQERLNLSNSKKIFEIPIIEEYRGGIFVHFFTIKHNRFFYSNNPVYVGWKNKQLKIEFETFRDKLLPGENEEWRIKISGYKKDKVMAEMVATLYDASLNAFKPHYWNFYIYPYNYSEYYFNGNYSFLKINSFFYELNWNKYLYKSEIIYDYLNWFGLYFQEDYFLYKKSRRKSDGYTKSKKMSESEPEEVKMDKEESLPMASDKDKSKTDNSKKDKNGKDSTANKEEQQQNVQIRTNFNETAFFYPELKTDEEGRIIISFKIPDSLTKWKMLGFAHTKNLEYGLIEKELVTQKDLMLMPNMPRFLRENDKIFLATKISNISDKDLEGVVTLELFDAETMKPVNEKFNNKEYQKRFMAKKGQSDVVFWEVNIPQNMNGITYRIIAKSENFSDGEESILPILPNRMLVIESLPLPVRTKGTKEFKMEKLISAKNSNTLTHQSLTLEFTSNPVWLAIQSLPYLMEYPYECSEQIFSRIYANSIALHIANSDSRIKDIYESWKNTEALESNLEKNQEVKNILLEETPWVRDAKNEKERKKRIGILFDLKRMDKELEDAVKKISKLQLGNGGFAWFSGLPDDRYITQHIISGFGRLKKLNISISNNSKIKEMSEKGVKYLDDRMREDYEYLIRYKIPLNQNNLSYTTIHYLYTRTLYPEINISSFNKKAYNYWLEQAEKYWLDFNIYCQGMIAIVMFNTNKKNVANRIIESLKERSLTSEEMGMYWKDNKAGYYWHEAPIETQSLLIEAFNDITKDTKIVDEMKVWLLKQKQTQNWKTTKATVDAVYSLILTGSDWIKEDRLVTIKLGDVVIDPANDKDIKPEKGTGYFKKSFSAEQVTENMGNIIVNKDFEGVSWGALYWQYYEQLDKITPYETPLKLRKKLFVKRNTAKGPVIEPVEKTKLKVGDEVVVRIELEVDRNMEYIHLKDARASSLEPVTVISTYKYQDGLWYYQVTKDASTNFFIPWLAKGSYVFEYSLRVTHKGEFSNGITTIQCMYAPEFSSHSEGVRIKVE